MTAHQLRKKLLASKESREKIAFSAGISYSWLSKFALDAMGNPRESSLEKLRAYFQAKS